MARIGFAQYHVIFGDHPQNFSTIRRLVEQAASADLLVLPELGATGYDFISADEVRKYAEPAEGGPTSALLQELSSAYKMTLVVGYPEAAGERLYNSAMLVQPNGTISNYRKIHLFSRENELFSPGDAPPPVVQTPIGRVGMMICFDWFFPETARVLALAGAQLIAHPSNLVLPYCQRAMYARSLENGVFSITANRTGTEDRTGRSLTFTGGSQVLDTRGNALTAAGEDNESVAVVEAEISTADDKQLNAHNHLLDSRRSELYSALI